MILLYLSIPVMLLAVAIAVVPLVWAMAGEQRHHRTGGAVTVLAPGADRSGSRAA